MEPTETQAGDQAQVIDREHVIEAAKAAAKRIALFIVAAVAVALALEWVGQWGTPIGVVFLAIAGVYLVRNAYAFLMGLIALLSKPANRGEGTPKVVWLLAWMGVNVVEAAVWIALSLYVIEAAGWWTEMQFPPVIDEYGQMQP